MHIFTCHVLVLAVGLHQEALQDAEKSRAMAESVLRASAKASSAYVRCFDLKVGHCPNYRVAACTMSTWHGRRVAMLISEMPVHAYAGEGADRARALS